jgi:hypothetical protein
MQKPAGDLLKALVATLQSEKSAATRKAYAGACGALAKSASEKRVHWLVGEALSMYDSGEPHHLELLYYQYCFRLCKYILSCNPPI